MKRYVVVIFGFDCLCSNFMCYGAWLCGDKQQAKYMGKLYCKDVFSERFVSNCFYKIYKINLRKFRRLFENVASPFYR